MRAYLSAPWYPTAQSVASPLHPPQCSPLWIPPAPAHRELMLVFSIDSATSTKLYLHGGNATEPAYIVSSEHDATHVMLRSGAGKEVGRLVYPGLLGASGACNRIRRPSPSPAARHGPWTSGSADRARRPAGSPHDWQPRVRVDHSHPEGYMQYVETSPCFSAMLSPVHSWPAGTRLASFLPSRDSPPTAFRPVTLTGNNSAKFLQPNLGLRRAHIVFLNALATLEAAAVRDETLLSLLAIRQSAKLATPKTDWLEAMLDALG
jgi:hypothetical protein